MLWLLACSDRPEGEFEFFDSPHGRVRVHFTREGEEAIDPADDDGNGLPDRAEVGGELTERSLETYAALGWGQPVRDGDEGGGDDLLDVYFAGVRADLLALARCPGSRGTEHFGCHLRVSPTGDDVRMLVAHEVFHIFQNGYQAPSEFWLEESGATWMETRVNGGTALYRSQWLLHHDCAVDGIRLATDCLGAAYGLSLWWEYLYEEGLDEVHRRTWEILAEDRGEAEEALDAALRESGTSLAEEWPRFALWGLATGDLAGSEGFDGAGTLATPPTDAEGSALRLTVDLEPMSVRYLWIDPAGGQLWLGAAGASASMRVTAVAGDGALDLDAAASPLPVDRELDLGSFPEGPVYVVLTNTAATGLVTPVQLCIAPEPCDPGCGSASLAGLALIMWPLGRRRARRPA